MTSIYLFLIKKKRVFTVNLKKWNWLFSQVFPSKQIREVHLWRVIKEYLFVFFASVCIQLTCFSWDVLSSPSICGGAYFTIPLCSPLAGFAFLRLPSRFLRLWDITTASGTSSRHLFCTCQFIFYTNFPVFEGEWLHQISPFTRLITFKKLKLIKTT